MTLPNHEGFESFKINDTDYQNKLREAYLVLCNTIPVDMKYLIRQVEIGDAIGVWRVLYDRFRHVTPCTYD